MIRRVFYILLLSIIGLSCVRKAVPGSSSNVKINEYSEDISYLLPKFEKEIIEEGQLGEKAEPVKPIVIESDNAEVDKMLDRIVETNKNLKTGKGYRIQVFSGNSRTDFENARGYLLRYFPELEVYESYSQPTYKIKAGDFLLFQDAEKVNVLLKQRFGTTRIISDNINIKKAFEIK